MLVEGEYAVVILKPAFVATMFGDDWETHDLYYGYNRALTLTGERTSVNTYLMPLARRRPVLTFSGTDWEDLLCPVYSLKSRQQVTLAINLVQGKILMLNERSPRQGNPEISPDGYLFFR